MSAWQAELNVRAYQLNADGAADETEGDVTSCQIWMLPATVRDHFALVVHANFPSEYFLMRPSCHIESGLDERASNSRGGRTEIARF